MSRFEIWFYRTCGVRRVIINSATMVNGPWFKLGYLPFTRINNLALVCARYARNFKGLHIYVVSMFSCSRYILFSRVKKRHRSSQSWDQKSILMKYRVKHVSLPGNHYLPLCKHIILLSRLNPNSFHALT